MPAMRSCGVFYWVMPVCGVVILLYSILNIVGIANGTIPLDASDEATSAIAKVEAEEADAARNAAKKEG